MALADDVLLPVSPDSPCGDDLEYDNRFQELERAAEGTPERIMGDAVIPAEEPDWKRVATLARTLLGETRDLRIAVQLVRAMAHTEGFQGVAEGLALVRRYLEDYWDCVHPRLDPEEGNDPTFRINTLENLDDPGFLLHALRTLPLVEAKGMGRFSLADVETAEEGGDEDLSPALIGAAFQEADPQAVADTHRQIAEAAGHLQAIRSILAEKTDPELAPRFERATELFQRLGAVFDRYATTTATDGTPDTAPPPQEDGTASPPPPGGRQAFRNREEIARTLELMCEYFEHHEPTSPVPLLLQRAKRLMTKDFMALVEELANDGAHQAANILGVERED